MKRSDFLKSVAVIPATLMIPPILSSSEEDMRVWAAGFWGNDKSLTIGGNNELDEQFFITYRKLYPDIMVPSYESWKKHFIPPSAQKFPPRFTNYRDAARSDWSCRELVARQRENMRRFPVRDGFGITEEDTKHKQEYLERMAEWCERMAKFCRKSAGRHDR